MSVLRAGGACWQPLVNFYVPLAGSRPGGRLAFLRAQESQQRRRAAQLGAVKLASRPAGAALKQPRRVRRDALDAVKTVALLERVHDLE